MFYCPFIVEHQWNCLVGDIYSITSIVFPVFALTRLFIYEPQFCSKKDTNCPHKDLFAADKSSIRMSLSFFGLLTIMHQCQHCKSLSTALYYDLQLDEWSWHIWDIVLVWYKSLRTVRFAKCVWRARANIPLPYLNLPTAPMLKDALPTRPFRCSVAHSKRSAVEAKWRRLAQAESAEGGVFSLRCASSRHQFTFPLNLGQHLPGAESGLRETRPTVFDQFHRDIARCPDRNKLSCRARKGQ